MPKRGECRVFYALDKTYSAVAVCGLGSECLGYNRYEVMDEGKEAIRMAAATGVRKLQEIDTSKIYVENFGHSESAAEGAGMGVWINQEFKEKTAQIQIPQIEMWADRGLDCDWDAWKIGLQKAHAQNLARQLQETPANLMTPTLFAQNIVEVLCMSGVNVEVKVRSWAESKKMNAYLAVAKGSCEPPIFLELSYFGTNYDERPIVLIGQGNTYDSGGLCKKSVPEMRDMRGDMTGAASVVAACKACAALKLPVNIRALIPLCEHIIGCNAMKPGDIVTAMNGKTIEVESADNEGTLILADALCYAETFGPKFIVDVGTLSRHLLDAVGPTATGIFTNSEELWQQVKTASIHTGDRVWRMPLWKYYTDQVTSSEKVDVQNVGCKGGGEPSKFAAFLREFVACGKWMHMDAYNVMTTDGYDYPYLRLGMAGRPTRTLIEFIAQSVCREKLSKERNSC